ncbi:unnamed protein product, partial [Discosporangium mesarthrocarpum]
MGNRGKGGSKGKGGKRGKGSKGRASKNSARHWGDEDAGRVHLDNGDAVVRKRPLETQESQDRKRRVRLMTLARTKKYETNERLSAPNYQPIEVPRRKPKARKRKRAKRPPRPAASCLAPFAGSDEESDGDVRERSNERGRRPQVAAGLASYRHLLVALQGGTGDVID